MTTGGFSGTRLGVMREVMAGYAERGEVHVEVYGSKTLGTAIRFAATRFFASHR